MFALSCINLRTLLAATLTVATLSSSMAVAAESKQPKAFLESHWFKSRTLHVDDDTYTKDSLEFCFSDAEHAFDDNPEAAKLFANHLEKAKLAQYLYWGTVGTAVTFLGMDSRQWHLSGSESGRIFSGLFWGGIIGSFYTLGLAEKNLQKAINVYNGFETAAKFQGKPVKLSLTPALVSTSVGQSPGLSFGLKASF
jgi:hypothetical protein